MWVLSELPYTVDLESKQVLKMLPAAHSALAELKGISSTIPNENILINTLGIQEAKDSSAIENIITTHDEIFKSELNLEGIKSIAAKEVQNYIKALKKGYELIQKNGFITNNIILEIQGVLEENQAGFRKLPGTTLQNSNTGKVVYTPPQNYSEIIKLMDNLEKYINIPELQNCDPLIKLAVIHFQFESIHPFYDGNGRTGRIINLLYLILQRLLDTPILYLSNFIIKNKVEYYNLLQKVRDENDWEEWLMFMIKGVEETSRDTIKLIKSIKDIMMSFKQNIRSNYKFYSQELLNNLFKHPYTKIEFMMYDLNVSRVTASNYLNNLAKDGILNKVKIGSSNFYINEPLFKLLSQR